MQNSIIFQYFLFIFPIHSIMDLWQAPFAWGNHSGLLLRQMLCKRLQVFQRSILTNSQCSKVGKSQVETGPTECSSNITYEELRYTIKNYIILPIYITQFPDRSKFPIYDHQLD
jgi:hypothetical protein